VPLFSIVLSLIVVSFLLLLEKVDPLRAISEMAKGAFGGGHALSETVVKTIPLLFTGLAVAAAFRMRLWNTGAEGQLYAGAAACTWVALNCGCLAPPILLALMFLAGFAAGAGWGGIAGIMRARLGANEIIVTLMMNYIAIHLTDFLVYGPWRDPGGYGFPKTAEFPKAACLLTLGDTRIHAGIFIALAAVLILWIIFSKTRWGFEIRVIGENPEAARYAGMSITGNIVLVMILSGGLAGLAGMTEMAGLSHRLQHGFSPGYGYTAIIIAWIARLNPISIVAVSFLMGGLYVGSDSLQIVMGLPAGMVSMIQGLILFFVLTGELLAEYRIARKDKEAQCRTPSQS
jgi:simple sugar transport system permease protein